MTATFDQRIRELSQRIGFGDLVGSVVVDQVYAKYQHERVDLKHPRGGEHHYLGQPLTDHREEYFTMIADTTLNEGPQEGMKKAVEDLAGMGGVEGHAPFLWGDLHHSGHPSVTDDGHLIYDRPPQVHRLTEAELREKASRLPLPPELIGYIWWKILKHTKPPGKGGG